MNEQISMFELLGETETPLIPFEEQKKGRKGWIIEISGIFLVENGFNENMIGVKTHAVRFVRDSSYDKYGRKWQDVEKIHPRDGGWLGSEKLVYAKRPTLQECIEFARGKYSFPEKVIYYERDGHDKGIYDYAEGNSKL